MCDSNIPCLTSCSYNIFYCPFFTVQYGTTPENERKNNPGSDYLKNLKNSIRSYRQVVDYPPNQVFIGNLDPKRLPDRPWHTIKNNSSANGRFGDILNEKTLFALIKYSDVFNLVLLEKEFAEEAYLIIKNMYKGYSGNYDFNGSFSKEEIEKEIADGALRLVTEGKLAGCIKPAHPFDINMNAHTILENLTNKATAVYAVRKLIENNKIDPAEIDYIIETSEEACGDMNQRGGGNFAKAIGELSDLKNATGSDTRSFCAGPIHGLVQAASLIKAGTFKKVIVAAGGTTAKLAMNSKKHIEKGFPVLEDCLGSFALLVERDKNNGLILRTDVVGTHKIGSGSSPQTVIQNLVADPLYKAGYKIADIDFYAPELHNPEITETAGTGNVTLSNLKMIAAMAVLKNEIKRNEINSFIDKHGTSGWAPSQGHIPSGIPALGWFLNWAKEDKIRTGFVIGKGSLFLGRMTNLFDGISILLENVSNVLKNDEQEKEKPEIKSVSVSGKIKIGLTIPGSEGHAEELLHGAQMAVETDRFIEVVKLGKVNTDPKASQKLMEKKIVSGEINGAVTFHYPFLIGNATVGHVSAPGTGKDIFIATTTGTTSPDRVKAMVYNAVSGIAAAKAYGINKPKAGFLNLEGSLSAYKIFKDLCRNGYNAELCHSVRGDELLRGNDVLKGTADVIVCDSLTGNIIIKLLSAYSTGGEIEVSGSGYGPGIGNTESVIGIISRATAAIVVKNALILAARFARAGLPKIVKKEFQSARAAGLDSFIEQYEPFVKKKDKIDSDKKKPDKKTIDFEIEGIDVLKIEMAVDLLTGKGIYCEAGMGCTGPVVMISAEDSGEAEKILKEDKYI